MDSLTVSNRTKGFVGLRFPVSERTQSMRPSTSSAVSGGKPSTTASNGVERRPQTVSSLQRKTKFIEKKRMSTLQLRQAMLDKQAEDRIEYIRSHPRKDKYGRPLVDGTPLGSGDKSWRLQYGFAGACSAHTPMLGIGISRDSFLPNECKNNEKNAFRDTPRSSKLSKEILKWVSKYELANDPLFMKNLRMVNKRVQSFDTLRLTPRKGAELKPMIYRSAKYTLLDKRNANAHFGHSTREQMTKATLWNSMGAPGGPSACNVTYVPKYKYIDRQQPRTHMGTATREQVVKSQLWGGMATGESSTEATYAPNFVAVDRKQPAFTWGKSQRPSPLVKTGGHDAPIYMVHFENMPQHLPRYKTFGAKYQSFGPKELTKSRCPKSKEWGPPPPDKNAPKKLNPTRYGYYLQMKNQPTMKYSAYKFWG